MSTAETRASAHSASSQDYSGAASLKSRCLKTLSRLSKIPILRVQLKEHLTWNSLIQREHKSLHSLQTLQKNNSHSHGGGPPCKLNSPGDNWEPQKTAKEQSRSAHTSTHAVHKTALGPRCHSLLVYIKFNKSDSFIFQPTKSEKQQFKRAEGGRTFQSYNSLTARKTGTLQKWHTRKWKKEIIS